MRERDGRKRRRMKRRRRWSHNQSCSPDYPHPQVQHVEVLFLRQNEIMYESAPISLLFSFKALERSWRRRGRMEE